MMSEESRSGNHYVRFYLAISREQNDSFLLNVFYPVWVGHWMISSLKWFSILVRLKFKKRIKLFRTVPDESANLNASGSDSFRLPAITLP